MSAETNNFFFKAWAVRLYDLDIASDGGLVGSRPMWNIIYS